MYIVLFYDTRVKSVPRVALFVVYLRAASDLMLVAVINVFVLASLVALLIFAASLVPAPSEIAVRYESIALGVLAGIAVSTFAVCAFVILRPTNGARQRRVVDVRHRIVPIVVVVGRFNVAREELDGSQELAAILRLFALA